MKINNFTKRLIIWKSIWFIIWLLAFIFIPFVFKDADLLLRLWVLFWYITFWVIIAIFWVMDKDPYFGFKMKFWFRWMILWWWLNFVLSLFAYNQLILLMKWTILDWFSPFIIVIEWMIIGLIIDYVATKYAWDWKKLIQEV